MKILKFSEPLPELILNGKKKCTWRVNDEKGIKDGDALSLCRNSGEEFASAEVTGVKEKAFGELAEEDFEGHERFSSESEMYGTYARYYNFEITPETRLKIIRFKILEKK